MAKASKHTGRKPWLPSAHDLERIEKWAMAGATKYEIADNLGISIDTLMVKQRLIPEFSEAIKKGRSKGIAIVKSRIFRDAVQGPPEMAKFYMKHVGGWQDTVDVNLIPKPVVIKRLNGEQVELGSSDEEIE